MRFENKKRWFCPLVLLVSAVAVSWVRGETVKIMSANTTSGNYQAYEAPGIRIFQALQPDIVLINEFSYESGSLRDLVDTALGEEYYYYCEPDEDPEIIPNGVISRWSILTAGVWDDPKLDNRGFAWASIDIPGDRDLHAVTAHFKHDEDSTQGNEAEALKAYIEAAFPSTDYIVVGGDMNIKPAFDRALSVFRTFLEPENHLPVDRNNNRFTSQNRADPYDWVMPNGQLDQYHATLYVGTGFQAFTEGIVFDSRVFTPLSEVPPVLPGDSSATNMQHMAVIKAFDVPVSCSEGEILEGFNNFNTGSRPGCWIFTNCNYNGDTYTTAGNYGRSSPALKLDSTGDQVTTRPFAAENDFVLTFWLKGEEAAPDSALTVEEYHSGWTVITELYGNPSSAGVLGPYLLNDLSDGVRFSYTSNGGNLALDDVRIGFPASPTPPTPTPTPTATSSATPTATPPPTPTPSASPPPSRTPTPSVSPTPSATPSSSPPPSPAARPAVLGDYSGDGTSDIALFRSSSGLWLIRGLTRAYFGSLTDKPVPQDYSGNGAWDMAIYRPSLGKWMVRGLTSAFYGVATDITVPGDYDGDGSADIALFRPGIGKWLVRGGVQIFYGFASDMTVPGDYNGDGTADIAVFRPSLGKWLVRNGVQVFYGNATDTVVPGDYTGDGSWNFAIFRPTTGRWLVKDGPNAYWGNSADTVQAGDYNGDGTLDFAVFRSSVGRWLVKGVTSAYYGASSDQPVTNP